MDRAQLEALLEKHQNGLCTTAEIRLLERWLNEVDDLTRDEDVFSSDVEAQQIENAIWLNLPVHHQQQLKQHQPQKQHLNYFSLYKKIGAAAAILLVFTFLLFKNNQQQIDPGDGTMSWDTISVAHQKIKQVILKDGSEVYLNAGSSIRYPSDYGIKNRQVELLYGEARFDVVHDQLLPFYVKAGAVNTKVLGTQFTVTAYPALHQIQVSVTRGKVSVATQNNQTHVLLKDQELKYDLLTHALEKHEGKISSFNPEAQSSLLINCSFEELAIRVENTYGYRLYTNNKQIRGYKFSGDIQFQESLSTLLRKICDIHGNQFSIKGKEVFMY